LGWSEVNASQCENKPGSLKSAPIALYESMLQFHFSLQIYIGHFWDTVELGRAQTPAASLSIIHTCLPNSCIILEYVLLTLQQNSLEKPKVWVW